jgi:hypothetical protein
MITEHDAALRAGLIIEYPAGDPDEGWTLIEFRQGWLVDWHGWKGPPGQFHIVIERRTGLVRYFTTIMPAQAIVGDYPAIRDEGRPDYRWESIPLPPDGGAVAVAGDGDGDRRRRWDGVRVTVELGEGGGTALG